MKLTDDLFERFFKKECTPEEEHRVLEYFQQQLTRLEKNVSEEDWASFKHETPLPSSISDKMLSRIDTALQHTAIRPQKTHRMYYRWASVAALLLLSFAAWKWAAHPRRSAINDPIAIAQPQDIIHHWKEKINKTGKTILLSLPDSSTVELSDKSSIRYEDSFTRTDRAIYLKGEALFTVVPDRSRPFSVHAGGLSTTVLGTIFRVSAFGDSARATEVSLLSGKVVVRPDSLLLNKGIKEMFLSPGQQLRFDPLKLTALVRPLKNEVPKTTAGRASAPPAGKIFRFNNTPLPDIFQTLEKEYHCRFIYKNETIETIRFTGSFNSARETLPDFLNIIGLLNNLTLTEKNNTFYIK